MYRQERNAMLEYSMLRVRPKRHILRFMAVEVHIHRTSAPVVRNRIDRGTVAEVYCMGAVEHR